jgi:hypothetical protein
VNPLTGRGVTRYTVVMGQENPEAKVTLAWILAELAMEPADHRSNRLLRWRKEALKRAHITNNSLLF